MGLKVGFLGDGEGFEDLAKKRRRKPTFSPECPRR
jgi:hypothetical protein